MSKGHDDLLLCNDGLLAKPCTSDERKFYEEAYLEPIMQQLMPKFFGAIPILTAMDTAKDVNMNGHHTYDTFDYQQNYEDSKYHQKNVSQQSIQVLTLPRPIKKKFTGKIKTNTLDSNIYLKICFDDCYKNKTFECKLSQ